MSHLARIQNLPNCLTFFGLNVFFFFRFSDLLVGAPRAFNRDEGRVFVYVNNKNVSCASFLIFLKVYLGVRPWSNLSSSVHSSVCLRVCVCVCQSVSQRSVCVSVCLSLCVFLFVCVSVCLLCVSVVFLPFYLSVCLCVFLFVCVCVCLLCVCLSFFRLSIYLSVCLSTRLPVLLSVCQSISYSTIL